MDILFHSLSTISSNTQKISQSLQPNLFPENHLGQEAAFKAANPKANFSTLSSVGGSEASAETIKICFMSGGVTPLNVWTLNVWTPYYGEHRTNLNLFSSAW